MTDSFRHTLSTLRVLHPQFAFRIVELDSLSSKADVTKLLGQLASVLLMFSLIMMVPGLLLIGAKIPPQIKAVICWTTEYNILSRTLLVSGLFTLLGWDALLPDRKDVFVLGPLPIQPLVLCLAKTGASCSAVLLFAFVLNCASGITWPAAFASVGFLATLRSYAAYWLVLAVVSIFLFTSVLAIQSAVALLLPRGLFLRVSALLQFVFFGILLATFFLEPNTLTPQRLALPSVASSWFPPYCFTAMFFQLQGTLPTNIRFVALHGWTLFAGALAAAAVCSAALYAHLLPRIVASADTVKTLFSPKRLPGLGGSLLGPLLLFAGRSLFRNKQQKLLLAFYAGIGSAILFAVITSENRGSRGSASMSLQYLVSTMVMMTVVVIGLRMGFSFPVQLQANWVFRLHQIHIGPVFLNATRWILIMLGVLPVVLISAVCGYFVEPARFCCEHVALLALYGFILVGLCLFGNRSIPYTCSYLPGTSQLPFLFWGSVFLFIPLVDVAAHKERLILRNGSDVLVTFAILLFIAVMLEWLNRTVAATDELRFDEVPEDLVVTLGLSA